MARTTGAVGWKTKQRYLHEKFPDQGWMEEMNKEVINEHYQAVKKESDKNRERMAAWWNLPLEPNNNN